ncbi:MAG: tRNA 4-thiouridine(8) synthase ThiI [Clostridia bacterium]|nr:tRNA 4-thiouridine(8) synthase ThiI [Clostridia bacterium]
MGKAIILRYSEIHLKGNNRNFFESLLIENVKNALSKYAFDFKKTYGRYVISNYDQSQEESIIDKLTKVFGLHSISPAFVVDNDLDKITEAALQLGVTEGTFKVECNRADKTFPMKSFEVAAEIGGRLLSKYHKLVVDIHNPQQIVNIDMRENKKSFVFIKNIPAAGGLPVGCSGKGLLLLSGGIDSPVAGYMMAKRGMKISSIHFHSYPFTSDQAREKVMTLAKELTDYTGKMDVYVVPFTDIQIKIHEECPEEFMITIMRRFMMRISQKIAQKIGAGALITGESLGQVASQTLESINTTNSVATMPVFRPLIGFDKMDIIEISHKIGTYQTSILPYEDCCTVFLPKHPVTKPKLHIIERAEQKLNIDELIEQAIENIELVQL